jgi:hypothetical protein
MGDGKQYLVPFSAAFIYALSGNFPADTFLVFIENFAV